jgi:hypothetical protein
MHHHGDHAPVIPTNERQDHETRELNEETPGQSAQAFQ